MTATIEQPTESDEATAPRQARGLRITLFAMIAVAALVIAGAVGFVLNGNGGDSSAATVSASSVDAGFARDMSTHHEQAVTMAGYERDYSTSATLKNLAFDIETSQQFQLGEMQGWLDSWGLARTSSQPQMSWMGHSGMAMQVSSTGLMPGMATPAQMNKLSTARGKTLDILFLQLMIHHHQGGLPMAQYALNHATSPYVRDLAQSMINSQSSEIIQMEQALRKLGSSPLPPPAN